MAARGLAGKFSRAGKWRDDRIAFAAARAEKDANFEIFKCAQEDRKLGTISIDELREAFDTLIKDDEIPTAVIAEIQTRRLTDRAYALGVSFPSKPYNHYEDTEFWEWHRVHRAHYLKYDGCAKVRREIYQEMEL